MNKLKLCDQSVEEHIKDENSQEFPDSPVVRTQRFHCRGLVQPLVRDLRSWKPQSAAKKKRIRILFI